MKRFRAVSVAAALSATLIIAPTPFASAEAPNTEAQTTKTVAEKTDAAKTEENKDAAEDANAELTAAEAALEQAEKKLDDAKADLTKIEQDANAARKAESEELKKSTGDQAGKLEAARIDNEHERSTKILAAMEKVTKAQADYDRAAAEVDRLKAGGPNFDEMESLNRPLDTERQQPEDAKGSAVGSSELPGGVNPVAGAAVFGLVVGIIAAIFSVVAVALPMLPQIVAAF